MASISPMRSFFTIYDYWRFNLVNNTTRPCGKCQYYGGVGVLTGDLLRGMFPCLQIVSDEEIECNVHPNCRCFLNRVLLAYDCAVLVPEAVLTRNRLLLSWRRLPLE